MYQKLQDKIAESGKKKVHLAKKMNIVPDTLRKKLKGEKSFLLRDVKVLRDELQLSNDEVVEIFIDENIQ